MSPTLNETLAFVAPGVLHRLGNAVFTIQGQAQLLAGAEDGPRGAILAAAARGGHTLAVLRSLLGADSAEPQDAGALLLVLADILRVPLRDADVRLECSLPDGERPRAVDGNLFGPVVLEAVRRCAACLPAGHAGTLELRLAERSNSGLVLRLSFRPHAGSLPFPLPFAELAAQLAEQPFTVTSGLRWSGAPGGIEVGFPLTGTGAVGATEA